MAAKKIKGARGVAKFLGKRGGLIGAGLATAATVGGAMAVTNAVAGGGEEQQTQAYSGGGVKPAPEMQPLPKKVTQERKEATEKSGPLGFKWYVWCSEGHGTWIYVWSTWNACWCWYRIFI